MEFAGNWILHGDGVTRPMIRVDVFGADGNRYGGDFLIDTGADQTVFNAIYFQRLGFSIIPMPPGSTFVGIGGESEITEAHTTLEFTAVDGATIHVRGKYAAFTDPAATAYNILGRDVLDHFDVIVSRRRDQVRLLGGNHYYQILT